jgi:hypothetical protein
MLSVPQDCPSIVGVWLTPVTGSHASAVHTLLSSTAGAFSWTHDPPLHASVPLQTFPSLGHSALLFVHMPPLAAVHAWQAPLHAVLQQTLSTQWFESQSPLLPQLAPSAALLPHFPLELQMAGETQSADVAQVFAQPFPLVLHLL